MRFWDSSAIVPVLVLEPSSGTLEGYLAEDSRVAAWWATPVECASAVVRRERNGEIDGEEAARAIAKLNILHRHWIEIPPSTQIRDAGRRLVRLHDLGAADALQLAAAQKASSERPERLPIVTLDDRLAAAARREGFPVVP